ncbi:MAG: class I SAM-dependent methyltransferase [Turicibacter sp.]
MNRADVIEKLFDLVDETAMIISAELKLNYLHALCETCKNIMSQDVNQMFNDDIKQALETHYEELEGLEFTQEEVRKALQLGILKGLKAERLSNEIMTPDSIAMMVGYLVSKFIPDMTHLNMADLSVGTGNFLTAILNYFEKQPHLIYGVDVDTDLLKIAYTLSDMQEHEIQFYQQSSLKPLLIEPLDLIIGDLPVGTADISDLSLSLSTMGINYLPYLLIENHIQYLKPGGYAFYVIPNDLFSQPHSSHFHELLSKETFIQGVLQLPETMFKSQEFGKSIFIIQKKGDNISPVKEVLLAELPSFSDAQKVNTTLSRIEDWIKMNK